MVVEYVSARHKFPKMSSGHEGYAIILEELDELWSEIKNTKNNRKKISDEASKECIQIAAMSMAFFCELYYYNSSEESITK